jgi:hypothetical protein
LTIVQSKFAIARGSPSGAVEGVESLGATIGDIGPEAIKRKIQKLNLFRQTETGEIK